MIKMSSVRLVSALMISTILAGCSTSPHDDAEQHNAAYHTQANENLSVEDNVKGVQGPSNVHIHHGIFLGDRGVRSKSGEPLPTDLEGPKSISGLNLQTPLTLDQIVRDLTNRLHIRISTENISLFSQRRAVQSNQASRSDTIFGQGNLSQAIAGVPTAPMVIGTYTGPLSDLLDRISAHFDVDWRYHNGVIQFIGTETREFTLAALPITYGTHSSSQGSVMSGSDMGVGTSSSGSQSGASNSDSANATIDYWDKVDNTLQKMLPSGTLYSVNKGSGTVVVTARPSILDEVETYIKSENQRLLRQVQVSVKILNVEAKSGENYNFNPSIVFNDAAKGLSFGYAGPAAAAATSAAANTSLGVLTQSKYSSAAAKNLAGSSLAIQALSTRANTSLMNSGTVLAMNNQLSPLSDLERQGYLAQMTQTLVQGSSTSSVSLSPGTVNTGFVMSVLPRIQSDNSIILSYKLTISELLDITQVGTNTNFIQVPHVTSRSFYESVHLHSGETIVMAGIRHNNNSLQHNGVGHPNMWLFGGGENSSNDRREVVVLITPTILDYNSPDNGLEAKVR